MGDPALADENDIHDFPPLSDPENWRGFAKPAYLHYEANWLLIVDNLSDFSHVAFAHTNTLGGSEEYAYASELDEIDKLDNGFKVDRWHHDGAAPPFHSKVIPANERDTKLDRCNATAMYIPGVFLMETIFAPVGWDKEKNDRSLCREYRNVQFMTPETRNTTHFFWDYLHNFDMHNTSISPSLHDSLLEGFMEDKIFIEEQQKLLEISPDFVPKTIGADEAFMHFRMRWNKQLKQENEANPTVIKENKRRIL
jgi:vanillate O-demethylase monooxygenase subunit